MDEQDIEFLKEAYSSTDFENPKFQKYKIEEKKISRKIDKQLAQDKLNFHSQVVLLLLGTGESGKSTIAKQLRVVNNVEFTELERKQFVLLVHSNILSALRAILKEHGGEFKDSKLEEISEYFMDNSVTKLNSDAVKDIKLLLEDPSIQSTIERGSEFHLDDSATYFLNDADRCCAEDYIPTQLDVIRCRKRTTGINETSIQVGTIIYRIVDVGGQKSERKKWAHVFEGVKAVIYCADIASYDQVLREDGKTNRMMDSLAVFKDICNNRWFQNSDVILFLNKKDIFEEKIKKVPLSVCFPDCQVDDYDKGIDFIANQYISCNKNPNKTIYWHVTCATDSNNILAVFTAVKLIILREALEDSGIGI